MKARALAPEATAQLRELAMEIQDQFTLCEQEWRTTVEYAQGMLEHARAIGEKLLAAKKLAGHGHWKSWVAANLRFSIDKTERLMRLHKNWDRIKSAPEPILGIKEAIAYLAAPKKQAKQENGQRRETWRRGYRQQAGSQSCQRGRCCCPARRPFGKHMHGAGYLPRQ